ncbi:MAG: aminoacetone oxidase family FAD-binding enzyme [Clostridiales bacterium]|nr:aminoacetone oxidase family FAD-binding enzyme [Clostridiales bacterium]
MNGEVFDCIILGGGASGLFAASLLIKETDGKANVLLIDGNDRCGKKLAMTGSGRCNLTNRNASADKYNTDCPERLEKCLSSFGYFDTVSFFENVLGIETVCDEGLYYPATYRAATVIDSFRFYLEDNGCGMKFGAKCENVSLKNGLYETLLKDGSVYKGKNFICATGGHTYPSTGSTGSIDTVLKEFLRREDLVPFKPALTSLTSKLPGIKALAGIRCRGSVTLDLYGNAVDASEGEIIFSKDGGISGICVMDVSGKAVEMLGKGQKPVAVLNLLGRDFDETYKLLHRRTCMFGQRSVTSALTGLFPRVLCEFLCRTADIDPAGTISGLSDKNLQELCNAICKLEIPVDGFGGTDKAQVSSGGIKLASVGDNMQYGSFDGLFIIGEALNVDGRCGGFNLQWAWSSAAAAAKEVALRCSN